MTEVNQFFNTCLGIDPMFLHSPDLELHPIWRKLSPWRQRMAIPVIDICRHLYETFPKTANPFPMPGVMLFHRPDLFCTDKRFVSWIHFLDSLLPNFQFIITLADRNAEKIPPAITKKRLPIGKTEGDSKRIRRKPARLPTKPVLLVQVDGKLPNLALMKLSRYHKEQGKEVILKRRGAFYRNAERVYASTIFNFGSSVQYLQQLRKYYGDALQVGGSGVDLSLRLPKKIERMPADYTLYPELEDRAIGFVTRGCPHRCPFCIVPEKEGHPRKVNSIRSLVDKNRKKVILLDDNLLSHPEATDILKEIASLNLKVNFTQSLDMRYLNQAKAELLKKIDCMNTKFTRPNHYFSLNDNKRFKTIRQKYQMLGFTYRDNVEFICMYGFNTTLAQDLERIRFLRSLPGAYVFMQEYKPVNNIVSSHDGQFFEGDVDRMLDELVRIVFTQNMKSMEKYYKWISRKYAQRYNRLHHGLVDTIFKYNNRSQKGLYIATLAGTRNGPAGSKAG
ncbi:MAG: radical SAM protein [Desulfatitalea sp.]|nr:radical SAM protein [Desulfatitalea sp.]NNK02061.1 radical SAM protein [Desulfatitalea sp.]